MKQLELHYLGLRSVGPDPTIGSILHMLALQFERGAVIDTVSDIFFVRQDLMNGAPGPLAAKVGEDSSGVANLGDLSLGQIVVDKRAKYPLHVGDFMVGSGPRITRSVWMDFCSPRYRTPFTLPD